LGIEGYKGLETKYRVRAVVRRLEVDYLRQLHEGDKIIIRTSIRLGDTSMTYEHSIQRGKETVSRGRVVSVFTDLNDKPISIPSGIKDKLR